MIGMDCPIETAKEWAPKSLGLMGLIEWVFKRAIVWADGLVRKDGPLRISYRHGQCRLKLVMHEYNNALPIIMNDIRI